MMLYCETLKTRRPSSTWLTTNLRVPQLDAIDRHAARGRAPRDERNAQKRRKMAAGATNQRTAAPALAGSGSSGETFTSPEEWSVWLPVKDSWSSGGVTLSLLRAPRLRGVTLSLLRAPGQRCHYEPFTCTRIRSDGVMMTPHSDGVMMTPHSDGVMMTPHSDGVMMTPHSDGV
ncbi:hypothetical protein EYF80_060771 [Liparis tanakae]|uniref:Uncharacterized protein n=1 Tax=Liparis tanakae TaxID=230148 RepID=A0A4Z2EL39_9TELE|nr:hypothetical protein EYF80_060771 [Liparis tanakae]